ncbi:uncharacterized protein [Primulina eburnea]|uniref:uncharacterized protein n=1 Tax=Primulina eburnea TaxID=1245227 RepID=UPI003C6CA011
MYDAKDEKLIEYAQKVDIVREKFTEVTFEQIPRKENEKTDTLAKMARAMGSWKTRDVVFQVELIPHTSSPAVEQEEEDWRTDIIDYLKKGKLPDNPREARKWNRKCSRYVMVGEVLYITSFAGPILRCLSYQKAVYVLREVHDGCCGNHLGAYTLARKVLLDCYCLPSVLHDAQELVMCCDSCQRHAQLHYRPTAMMKAITAACSFDQWGIDIVEAEPLARITENDVLKFLWKNIVCRYGSNGQVEVTNRTLVQGLKVRLGNAKGNWVDELPSVLWAYQITPREGTKETPFCLVYSNEAVLPAEIGLESARVMFCDDDNGARRPTDLDLLEEKREAASIHMEAYKNRFAHSYNRRVIQRNFQVDDLVLRKVQEEQRGKMDPKWEGPFKVIDRLIFGAYYLENAQGKALKRPWNAYHLRKYYS